MNTLAEELRDEGMANALRSQERQSAAWGHTAWGALLECLETFGEFTAEQCREFAELGGVLRPPEPRAWGSIFRKAVLSGLIEPCGWARSSNPKAHTRPVTVWRRKDN